MKDLVDILCWFISIAIRFLGAFNADTGKLQELTSKLKELAGKSDL